MGEPKEPDELLCPDCGGDGSITGRGACDLCRGQGWVWSDDPDLDERERSIINEEERMVSTMISIMSKLSDHDRSNAIIRIGEIVRIAIDHRSRSGHGKANSDVVMKRFNDEAKALGWL